MMMLIPRLAGYALLFAVVLAMAGCTSSDTASPPADSPPAASPPAASPPVNSIPVTWYIPDGTTLDATQMSNLFDTGQIYYNVQSESNSTGEIRGGIAQPLFTFQTDAGDPFAPNPSNSPVTFATIMSGNQVRPRNVVTSAKGYGSITFDPVTKLITGFVVTSGISGKVAEIRDGLPGADGVKILALEGGPVVWTVPAGTLLNDSQIASLSAGAYHFAVTSEAFPAGEIRGQLDQQVRCASLKGSNEVPQVTTSASGTGHIALKKSTGQFSGFVKVAGITSTITSIFLQVGPAGVNGIPIVSLQNRGNGVWEVPQNTILGAAHIANFNSDELYLNVHTVDHLGGEIRGQILKSSVKIGASNLDGSQEVPPVSSQGTGVGRLAFNVVTEQLSGSLETDKISGTSARLYSGSSAVNGLPIVTMTTTTPVTVTPAAGLSFALDIKPIFNASCAVGACHVTGGSAPMSLQPEFAYANTLRIVVPGNSASSYFVSRLTGAFPPRMPLGRPALSTTDLDLIRAWIDKGAEDN